MPRTAMLAALLLILAATSATHAQPGQEAQFQRFERQLDELNRQTRLQANPDFSAVQRALVEYGGYFTFSLYALDDFNARTHILREYEGIAYTRVNLDEVHQLFIRASTTYQDFNTGDDFDGEGDDWVEPTLDRLVYRFDLQRALAAYEGKSIDSNVVIQAGRLLVHWGNGLALSDDIDGGIVTLSHGPISLDMMIGRRRESNFDIDPFRPSADTDTDRLFYGGLLTWQVHPKHQIYTYAIRQEDQNDPEFIVDPNSGNFVTFQYESYYAGGGAAGSLSDRVLYAVEAVYEGGDTLSRPPDAFSFDATQSLDPISAYALNGRMDYLLLDANFTRLQLEATVASGDDDRSLYTNSSFGGNQAGTYDNAFNSFGLVKTGLAFSPAISNLLMLRGGASTFPLPNSRFFRRLQVGIDLFAYQKYESDGPISEPTSDSGYLGFESDFFANWQITSDLSLALRYGMFVPGDAVGDIPGTSDHVRHFIYSGLTFGF